MHRGRSRQAAARSGQSTRRATSPSRNIHDRFCRRSWRGGLARSEQQAPVGDRLRHWPEAAASARAGRTRPPHRRAYRQATAGRPVRHRREARRWAPAPIAVSPNTRRTVGKRDRVARHKCQARSFRAGLNPVEKPGFPLIVAIEGQRQQGAGRRRAFGGKVGQVDRNQLPPDALGRIGGQIMHALGDAVVGDHQSAEQRGIVAQAARFGRRRDPPQPRDHLGFVHLSSPLPRAPWRWRRAGR